MKAILSVAAGGALGAVLRYLISLLPVKGDFPVLTLITNLLGAILIGIIVGLAVSDDRVSPNQVLFWKTGVCGGFTTFSTFSLEGLQLLEQGKYLTGGSYIVISVLFSLVGVLLGRHLGKMLAGNW